MYRIPLLLAFIALTGLAGCHVDGAASPVCFANEDCPADEICLANACVVIDLGDTDVADATDTSADADVEDTNVIEDDIDVIEDDTDVVEDDTDVIEDDADVVEDTDVDDTDVVDDTGGALGWSMAGSVSSHHAEAGGWSLSGGIQSVPHAGTAGSYTLTPSLVEVHE